MPDAVLSFINNIVTTVSDFLYDPWVPLLLVAAGVIFSAGTGFVQLRMLGETIRVIREKPKNANAVSSFGALMVSTASRVGTGNIIGVSQALCLGGPGALFWMWIIALLGGASAFVESTLAQIYKRRSPDGTSYGGPSYYMETALKQRWLGLVFAVIIILTYAVGYNALASYNLQSAFAGFRFYRPEVTPVLIGVVLAVLFALCVMGGGKRLTHVTQVLVPVMGIAYVVLAVVVMALNAGNLPAMFRMVLSDAFNFKAIFGGFAGSCLMYGVKRGLYSNEAGMGSAPNAAATADVSHPVKQGLVQMLSVFLDTLVICSATAFMCLSSGVTPAADKAGAPFVQESLRVTLGSFGPIFIAAALSLFAFTTLIGNYYYCEGCLRYILKRTPGKGFMSAFRLASTAIVLVGAVASMDLVWNTADLMQALMVVINIPVILLLGRTAIRALKDYRTQRAAGKDPVFRAADIDLKEHTDFWN
ncbi:MAG: alanine:cation symporter family protein [Oscillospiraceae bacterium]|nr:alanine:cation symporter family protein [Oscillospiraceae bacterium]